MRPAAVTIRSVVLVTKKKETRNGINLNVPPNIHANVKDTLRYMDSDYNANLFIYINGP